MLEKAEGTRQVTAEHPTEHVKGNNFVSLVNSAEKNVLAWSLDFHLIKRISSLFSTVFLSF